MPERLPRRDLLRGLAAAGFVGGLPQAPLLARESGSNSDAHVPDGALSPCGVRPLGLLHAVIARPPLPGWRLAGYDAVAPLGMCGIVDLVVLAPTGPGPLSGLGGIAVLARDRPSALRGLDAVNAEWTEASARCDHGRRQPFDGWATAMSSAELPCAMVDARRDGCAIWANLSPETDRSDIAAMLGLRPGDIVIAPMPPATPNGLDHVLDAARLSRKLGAPVALTWTLLDDMPFKPRLRSPLS